jgi:ABC-type transport system involved in multi-copper enzyme maturation permease subunit
LLLFVYVAALGGLVVAAWPQDQTLDLARPEAAKRLVSLFFLGQFVLASLMTPSFASGAITGEKERQSYEMLLASPVRPGAIVVGKLLAALCHLGILMLCSLPIVMLCLPLGGVNAIEVLATYASMMSAIVLFGMICMWASSYFKRTSAALVVSYLMILPLVMLAVLVWNALGQGPVRLLVAMAVVPLVCLLLATMLGYRVSQRLLKPADLGSEGREVVDLDNEANDAVGLYIARDEWPDRLFAPPKRTTFLADGANPIYDKEMRSEIFSQGTLMLRLVIQISMGLALPLMAICLFVTPSWAPWYIAYVLLFNMLVGPVFSAGSVCSERERETLDLLLTTLITPSQILWGKLLSGLRVSSVLTAFLLWPVVLACLMPVGYWSNLPTMFGYLLATALTCATTAVTALVCSTLFHKTSQSLVCTYVVLFALFVLPMAAQVFAATFFGVSAGESLLRGVGLLSPFAATFSLPLQVEASDDAALLGTGGFAFFGMYVGATLLFNLSALLLLVWLFANRWRVSD